MKETSTESQFMMSLEGLKYEATFSFLFAIPNVYKRWLHIFKNMSLMGLLIVFTYFMNEVTFFEIAKSKRIGEKINA